MPRPSTVLVIFVVAMNLFAGAFVTMGVMDDIGLADRGGQNDQIDENKNADLNTGTGVGGTLFGMYNVLSQQVEGVYSNVYPALDMMERAGLPGPLAYGVLGNLFSFVILFDVLSYIRGWGL
jgi:hypothetical protein